MNKILLSVAIIATAATARGEINEKLIKARILFETQYKAMFGESPLSTIWAQPAPECACDNGNDCKCGGSGSGSGSGK